MQLTVVRHGETIENVNQIVQGHNHGTLTDKGHQQAKGLAEKLKGFKFDQIYSSDLNRCLDTAKYIMEFHKNTPFIATSALREVGMGTFQGRPAAEVNWDKMPGTFFTRKPGNGESIQEASNRIIDFTNLVLSKNKGHKILFITHGGPMRIIKAGVEGLDVEELQKIMQNYLENCAIWEFEISKLLQRIAP